MNTEDLFAGIRAELNCEAFESVAMLTDLGCFLFFTDRMYKVWARPFNAVCGVRA